METARSQYIDLGAAIDRRQLLRRLAVGVGLVGVALSGCGGTTAQPIPAAAKPSGSAASASVAASAGSRPASSAATSGSPAAAASWDSMVAAAKREGQVVLAGPPDPNTRNKLPAAIQQAFGIQVQYLSQNSSQIAARMQSERASNQYALDLMLAGADTVYNTLVARSWLDPLKPALLMPGVADASKWKTGGPWFRDTKKDTVLQLFNTVTATITLNTQFVQATDIPTAQALLDPKWKGKIASFDPSVNGIGLPVGAALYLSKGADFMSKLYVGQKVALTQDYKQIADWVAHGSYPHRYSRCAELSDGLQESRDKVCHAHAKRRPKHGVRRVWPGLPDQQGAPSQRGARPGQLDRQQGWPHYVFADAGAGASSHRYRSHQLDPQGLPSPAGGHLPGQLRP